MKLFLDTASIEEIRRSPRGACSWGSPPTPPCSRRKPTDPDEAGRQILDEVEGDVSLEVTAPKPRRWWSRAGGLAEMGPNAVVKVPMTPDGLEAGRDPLSEGIRINMTLVFSAGAGHPGRRGRGVLRLAVPRAARRRRDAMGWRCCGPICDIYAVQGYETKVLAASLRHPMHVVEAAHRRRRHRHDAVRGLHEAREAPADRPRHGAVPGRLGRSSSTELEGEASSLMDTTTERTALEGKLLPELQQIAQTLGVEGTQKLRKAGLIDAIVAASSNGEGSTRNGDEAAGTAAPSTTRSARRPRKAARRRGDERRR